MSTNAGGTIPPDILVTADRPDIVIIDKRNKTLNVFELTVTFEDNIESRNAYKKDKYSYMKSDITKYHVNIEAFEIGVRGYISKENRHRIKQIFSFCQKTITLKNFEENIARLAIDGSRYIYLCRNQTEWVTPTLLTI